MAAFATAAVVATSVVAVAPSSSAAGATAMFDGTITPVSITEGERHVSVNTFTTGPDGHLWGGFQSESAVGRVSETGSVTLYATSAAPRSLAAGPDGNVWFTTAGTTVGRVTPAGVVTEFAAGITPGAFLQGITAGPDGNLWFTEASRHAIGRITPTGTVTEFTTGITGYPDFITAGVDGNLWFTESAADKVARITPTGVVDELSLQGAAPDAQPWRLTSGPDGYIWVGLVGGIARISVLGGIQVISAGLHSDAPVEDIVTGPDGNLWAIEDPSAGDYVMKLVRVTTAGAVTEYRTQYTGTSPWNQMAVGPDGNLWVPWGGAYRLGFAYPPPAPAMGAATAGDAAATLTWTAPVVGGTSPVTSYIVTPYANGVAQAPRPFDASTTTRTLTGLTNGATYTFKVAAANDVGTGPQSAASAPVVPHHHTQNQAFVHAAYSDFLSRQPTGTELDDWVPFLDGGGTRSAMVDDLAGSPEWVSTIVKRFYLDTLGRTPDSGGLAYWDGMITSGRMSVADVAAQMYASAEYYSNFGGATDRTWIEDLYEKILRRAPDEGGVRYWVATTAAQGRVAVALSFYQSLESRMDRVALLYEALLHREPDAGGQRYWADVIASSGDVTLAKYLALSAEYYSRAWARFP